MILAGRYLAGVAVVAAATAAAVAMVPADVRGEVGWGAAVGLLLQAPLGWWTLRTNRHRALPAGVGLGMLVRFTVIGVAGLVVIPALGVRAGPMLVSMVGVLVALLLVEGAAALREHSREDQR